MADSLLKRPSGFLPLAMSLAAIALILGHVAVFGLVHQPDEGTPAHLFQLLMAGQVPIVIYFALKWLPRAPRSAGLVLGLQAAGVVIAVALVYWLT
jgi:hypothetical protein